MTPFQILFIAGITNIIFLVMVLLSCRCMVFSKYTQKLLSSKLNKYHCWYWWGFIASVLVHTVLAFYLFGWPF